MAVSARITSKGQITIPKTVRDELGVKAGDRLEFLFADDHLEVRPVRQRRIEEFRGIFSVDRALDIGEERDLAWQARMRELGLLPANGDE